MELGLPEDKLLDNEVPDPNVVMDDVNEGGNVVGDDALGPNEGSVEEGDDDAENDVDDHHGGELGFTFGWARDGDGVSDEPRPDIEEMDNIVDDFMDRIVDGHDGFGNEGNDALDRIVDNIVGGDDSHDRMGDVHDDVSEEA